MEDMDDLSPDDFQQLVKTASTLSKTQSAMIREARGYARDIQRKMGKMAFAEQIEGLVEYVKSLPREHAEEFRRLLTDGDS